MQRFFTFLEIGIGIFKCQCLRNVLYAVREVCLHGRAPRAWAAGSARCRRPRGGRRTRVVRVAVQALGAQDLIARMEKGDALREAHARKRQRGHARAVGHGCALGGLEHHLRAARRTHRRAGRAGPWQRCAALCTFSAPATPAPDACTLPTGVPMQLVSHSAA